MAPSNVNVVCAADWVPPPGVVAGSIKAANLVKKEAAEARALAAASSENNRAGGNGGGALKPELRKPSRVAISHSRLTSVVISGTGNDAEKFVFVGCEDGAILQFLSPSLDAVPVAPPEPGETEAVYCFREHKGAVVSLCCAPAPPGEASGTRVFSGGRDDTIVIWTLALEPKHKGTRFAEVPTLRKLAVLVGHSLDVVSLVATADGSHLYSGSEDNTIIEWTVSSAKLNRQFHLPKRKNINNYAHSLQVSRDEESLWVGMKAGSLLHIRLDDGEIIERIRSCKTDVRCVLLSHDGSELWFSGDTVIRHMRRDDEGAAERAAAAMPADASALASAQGMIDATAQAGCYIRLRSLLGHEANVCSLACSLDERYLYSGNVAGVVLAHDVSTGEVLRSYRCAPPGEGVASRVPALALRSSGELYAVGGGTGRKFALRAWKVPASSLARAASAAASSSPVAPPSISVAIETDVGHDCDDLVALLVALSDHKAGRICIKYIATVSRNNVERAKLVQWLCWRMGVSGIPIIPSSREEAATAKGVPLDNSVPLWAYLLDEERDEYVVDKLAVPHPIPANVPSEDVCKLVTGDSLEARRAILQSSDDVNVLIIGPGVEAAAYHGFERRISRVVWQGYRGDKASFNIGCDHVAYTKMSEWCASAGVTELFVGKSTAYETRLTREQFEQLRDKASDRGLDLQMLLQLGVMEFRDAARNLFNMLNFGIASPSNAVPESMKHMAREYNNQTDAAEWKDVLQMPSTRRAWFAALKSLTPMYDLTAYLLLRDANDLEDKVEREISHPLYRLMPSEGGRVWTVGVDAKDAGIVGDKEAYLSTIVEEILKSLTQ